MSVLTVGDCCCDLIFGGLMHTPRLGEEIYTEEFVIKPGGIVNTAIALSCLGMSSSLLAITGDDFIGEFVRGYIRSFNVDISRCITAKGSSTATTAIFSTKDDRGFISYKGESGSSGLDDVLEQAINKSGHLHLSMQYKNVEKAMKLAKTAGKTISVDTGWSEDIYIENYKNVLASCNIFLPNEKEALFMTRTDNHTEALELLSDICFTVIKLGEKGCVYKDNGKLVYVEAFIQADCKDFTGAGDSFNAGYIYGRMNGLSLYESARFANACGCLAITFIGGTDTSFTKSSVMEILSRSR